MRSRAKVEAALEKAFLADRGFEVPTIVFTPTELTAIADEATEFAKDHGGVHYVSLLKDEPSAAADQEDRGGRWRASRRGSAAAPCTCCSGRTTTRRS